MILLEKKASMIITDSGGVQKESHFFSKPCIVLRKETEWVELVKNGTVRLADADPKKITEAWEYFMNNKELLQYPGLLRRRKGCRQLSLRKLLRYSGAERIKHLLCKSS